MSLSTCEHCGGHIPLGPDASNCCEVCGRGLWDGMVSVDSLIRNRETEAHADEWRDRAEKAEARVAELEQLLHASTRLATAYTALEECYRESDEENAATDAATGTMDEAFREFAATLNKINQQKR